MFVDSETDFFKWYEINQLARGFHDHGWDIFRSSQSVKLAAIK